MDLAEQLDRSLAEQNKYQSLLRELLEAQRNRKSEQLSKDQLALFEAAWKARSTEEESAAGEDDDDLDGDAGTGPKSNEGQSRHRAGSRQLDILWQRHWRQDGGDFAQLHCFLQAVRSRAVCLVPRRAHAH